MKPSCVRFEIQRQGVHTPSTPWSAHGVKISTQKEKTLPAGSADNFMLELIKEELSNLLCSQ